MVRLAGRHRVLTAAACVVLALLGAGTVGALTGGTSRPSVTAGPVRTAAPVTTVPSPQRSLHAGTAPSAGLPYGSVKQPSSVGASGAPSTTPTSPSLPSGAVNQNARIEQTGTLAVSVGQGRLGASMDRLEVLAGANGGFVASSQTQSGRGAGGSPYGSVTLEVPVGSFQATLKAAEALGRPTNVSTKATDVTGQYVDLQARIASLEASRQQYLTIMSRATTVGDVLAVQAQLDSIQSQIEQLQGQLQVLTAETSYSTLSVTIDEGTPPVPPGPLPQSGLVRAWHDSVGGFVAGVDGVVRVAGPVLFALLCLTAALVVGRTLWRRSRRHLL